MTGFGSWTICTSRKTPRYLHHKWQTGADDFWIYPGTLFPARALPNKSSRGSKPMATYGVTLIGSGWWDWRAGATGDWTNVIAASTANCPMEHGKLLLRRANKFAIPLIGRRIWPR